MWEIDEIAGTDRDGPSNAPITASNWSRTMARSAIGNDMPEIVAEAGLGDGYTEAIERAEDLYRTLASDFPEQAMYAVALAHRIRYVLQCNAREAMHLIELRSGSQGHPAYRRVAQQMHRAIAERSGHRALADAMTFVDHGSADL